MKRRGPYLLCSDIGTSSIKTKLYTLKGEVAGDIKKEYALSYPQTGWVEVHPETIWKAVQTSIKHLIRSARIKSEDIEGISISGMTPSCLPVNNNGDPLRPALIWCDSRAIEECDWIRENIGVEVIHRICGNTIAPYFGGPKWLWFKNKESGLFGDTWKLLQCNSYIIYKLTSEVAMDFSQAGLCVPFFDLRKKAWSYELCDTLGFDMDVLPEIFSSSQVVGETSASCKGFGLEKGIPVVAGGGDFACSALGCGVFQIGEACQMLGTAGDFIIPVEGKQFDPRLINTLHVSGGYVSFGNVLAGGVVNWFRNLFEALHGDGEVDFQVLEEGAGKISPGSDGLIMLPQLIGGIAPEWDVYRRGVIFGISRSHGPFHIYRAILEGVAYAFRYILEIALETGAEIKSIVAVNGGAKNRLWRQIFADVMDLKVKYYVLGGDATIGDAALAAKGIGYIDSFDMVKNWLGEAEENQPNHRIHEKYLQYYRIYRDIYEHLGEDFKTLFNIIYEPR